MLFLYSRKPQLLLLFCWCVAVSALFAYVTGNDPLHFLQKVSRSESRARLGAVPPPQETQAPSAAPSPAAPPEPAHKPEQTHRPEQASSRGATLRISVAPPPRETQAPSAAPSLAAQPEPAHKPAPALNRGTALRIFQKADGDARKLVLEFDYAAAEKNGFSLDKARQFYTTDTPTPTIVVDLGRPWELELKELKYPLNMPQATHVSLWMTPSGQLRLVTHARTTAGAAEARVSLHRTQTGLREEIHFLR